LENEEISRDAANRRRGSWNRAGELKLHRLGLAVGEVTRGCREASGWRWLVEKFVVSDAIRQRCQS
jgi:hypothetical protein